MFSKTKQTKQPTANKSSSLKKTNHTPSIISEDVRLVGSIMSQGEVQLDGRIEGDIKVDSLVIGTTGVIEGIVEANTLIIKGKIVGSLNAGKVSIHSSAHVHGDVFHDSLSIESGAVIEGNLKQRFESDQVGLISNDLKPASEVKALLKDDPSDLSFTNKKAATNKK